MNALNELRVTRKTAWHLAQRIRECWDREQPPFAGPVTVDETYIGGRDGNNPERMRRHAGRGEVGKAAVASV